MVNTRQRSLAVWLLCSVLVVALGASRVAGLISLAVTANFSGEMYDLLESHSGSSEPLVVELSSGNYAGCAYNLTLIDVNVTLTGAGMELTTVNCRGDSLQEALFTCGSGCTVTLKNLTVTGLLMDFDSDGLHGALASISDGSLMVLEGIAVTESLIGTIYTEATSYLGSSVLKVSGNGTRLKVFWSTFFNNTVETGVISAQDGAYVLVYASTFELNVAHCIYANGERGGALSFYFAFGDIFVSSFVGNAASSGGVAYCEESEVTFESVTTQDSTAQYGGVVFQRGRVVNFHNVTTQTSSVVSSGGVAQCESGSLHFFNVTTQDSFAEFDGGVVHLNNADVTFENVINYESSADGFGGVIFAEPGQVELFNVATYDSIAGSGGVVYVSDGTVTFENVMTHKSSASTGGVIATEFCRVDFTNVTTHDSLAIEKGGVASVSNGEAITFTNVTTHNSSVVGIGISFSGYGGVVDSSGSDVIFVDVTTYDSSANSQGGVVRSIAGAVEFFSVTTHDSFAGEYGGVVTSLVGNVTFLDVNTHASSSTVGGVLFSSNGHLEWLHVTTYNSSASDRGGVFRIAGVDGTFNHVTTHDSFAVVVGGVASAYESSITLDRVTTYSSSTNGDGGVVAIEGGVFTFERVMTHNSTCNGDGGVVHSYLGSVNFDDVSSYDSSAGGNGAFLVLKNINLFANVTDCSVRSAAGNSILSLERAVYLDRRCSSCRSESEPEFNVLLTVPCLEIPFLSCVGSGCQNSIANLTANIGCRVNDAPLCWNNTDYGQFCQGSVLNCSSDICTYTSSSESTSSSISSSSSSTASSSTSITSSSTTSSSSSNTSSFTTSSSSSITSSSTISSSSSSSLSPSSSSSSSETSTMATTEDADQRRRLSSTGLALAISMPALVLMVSLIACLGYMVRRHSNNKVAPTRAETEDHTPAPAEEEKDA